MTLSLVKIAVCALLISTNALAAVVITSAPTSVSLNNAVNITWTGGTSAASGTGTASVILYTHTDATYTMKAVLSSFAKGGSFTWTPSTSNALASNVTYAIGIQDSTAQIGYTDDFTLSTATANPSSSSTASSPSATASSIFPDENSALSKGAMIGIIVVSILAPFLVLLAIYRCIRARRQEKRDVQDIILELQGQGHGPAVINEFLARRAENIKAEARAAKIDRRINRRIDRL